MKKITYLFIGLIYLQQSVQSGPVYSIPFQDDTDEETVTVVDFSIDILSSAIEAIEDDNVKFIEFILDIQPEIVNQQDNEGLTLLHHALKDSHKLNSDIVSILIKSGADRTRVDNFGITPEELAYAHKIKIECDFESSIQEFNSVATMWEAMSPESPTMHKRH